MRSYPFHKAEFKSNFLSFPILVAQEKTNKEFSNPFGYNRYSMNTLTWADMTEISLAV